MKLSPAGTLSVTVTCGVTPSCTVSARRKVAVSPIAKLVPLVPAWLVASTDFASVSVFGTATVSAALTVGSFRSPETAPGSVVACVTLAVLEIVCPGWRSARSATVKVNTAEPPAATVPPLNCTSPEPVLNAGVKPAAVLPKLSVALSKRVRSSVSSTVVSKASPVPVLLIVSVIVSVSPASPLACTMSLVIVIRGSTTVTFTAGVVKSAAPSVLMSKLAVFASTVCPGGVTPALPATSSTRAVTRMRKRFVVASLSPVTVIAPNVQPTSSPAAAPPLITGAGTVPAKSAASSPPLAAAVVTMLVLS